VVKPAHVPLRDFVGRFLTYLASEKRVSPHTLDAYGRDLEALCLYADEKEKPSLTLYDLRGWLATLSRTHATASVARKIAAVRTFYRFLEKRKLLVVNPAAELASPKVRRELPARLSQESMAEVLASAEGDAKDQLRDLAVMELLYGGGIRVSELSALDMQALDLQACEVRVLGKGNKERIVPFGRKALQALRAYLEVRIQFVPAKAALSTAVFLSTRGRRLGPRAVQLLVRKYGILGAGRPDLHPRAFRHSCATHLLDGGADLRVIQEVLGHASLSTTQRYTHVSVEHLLRVYDKAHPLANVKARTGSSGASR
jgi:integrase/recombinase XerC